MGNAVFFNCWICGSRCVDTSRDKRQVVQACNECEEDFKKLQPLVLPTMPESHPDQLTFDELPKQ